MTPGIYGANVLLGKPGFSKKQTYLFFPPDFADDFPVAMQISNKYSLIYVITKLGLLFVYDLAIATTVYRNRISTDPIFLTTKASSVGGFYDINRRGQVLLAPVSEATIVPFISGQSNNLELAMNLSTRGNLPGAENLSIISKHSMSRNPFEFRQQPVLDSSRKKQIQLTVGVFAAVGIAASKALVHLAVQQKKADIEAGIYFKRRITDMGTYKPHIVVIAIQFAYAGLNIISKAALINGMSHFVFVVYRHLIATIFLSPLAYFLERNGRPPLTFYIFCRIFIIALCGITISQNLYFAGLNYTSPTLAGALTNGVPAMTFVMAIMFRLEKFRIKSLAGKAKVFGTAVCIGGSVMVSLYKGPVIPIPWFPRGHVQHSHIRPGDAAALNKEWLKGCLFIVISVVAWSTRLIQQAMVVEIYPAQLSMTALMCLLASVQSALIASVFERNAAAWTLKFDIQLLSVVYAGIIVSGAVYYLQIWCISKKGPVFLAMFSPVLLITVSILSFFIFSEHLHLGIAVGGVLVVMGLYTMLWGSKKDRCSVACCLLT